MLYTIDMTYAKVLSSEPHRDECGAKLKLKMHCHQISLYTYEKFPQKSETIDVSGANVVLLDVICSPISIPDMYRMVKNMIVTCFTKKELLEPSSGEGKLWI